jgi:hypothetical protein
MNTSLKIGAVAGLIAGIISGLVFSITSPVAASLGFYTIFWRQIIVESVGFNLLLDTFLGLVFGIIFSKVYSVIPGKDSFKGLFYGIIIYFFMVVRTATFNVAYGNFLDAAGFMFSRSFMWIAYGLVLGFLYNFLSSKYYPTKEIPKVKEYDMKEGILPGAIAGLLGGIAAGTVAAIGSAMQLWVVLEHPIIFTFDFWLGQVGSHTFINLIWGILFGVMYPKVYNIVPKKGITKGLIYGMTIWFIVGFINLFYWIVWAALLNHWSGVILNFGWYAVGIAHYIVYGLVLGLLYKKLSK